MAACEGDRGVVKVSAYAAPEGVVEGAKTRGGGVVWEVCGV